MCSSKCASVALSVVDGGRLVAATNGKVVVGTSARVFYWDPASAQTQEVARARPTALAAAGGRAYWLDEFGLHARDLSGATPSDLPAACPTALESGRLIAGPSGPIVECRAATMGTEGVSQIRYSFHAFNRLLEPRWDHALVANLSEDFPVASLATVGDRLLIGQGRHLFEVDSKGRHARRSLGEVGIVEAAAANNGDSMTPHVVAVEEAVGVGSSHELLREGREWAHAIVWLGPAGPPSRRVELPARVSKLLVAPQAALLLAGGRVTALRLHGDAEVYAADAKDAALGENGLVVTLTGQKVACFGSTWAM